jgi:hypothetical protein
MRPADLPPPRGIPGIGAPAVRHQDAAEPLAQQGLRHLGPPRQAHRKDGDPHGDCDPQPCARATFAPSRLVHVGHRLRTDIGLGRRHRSRHGLHGGLLEMRNRAQPHGQAEQVCHDLLGRALRQARRARAQRHDGLDTRPKASGRDPGRQRGTGGCPAGGTDQPVQLIFGHHRRDGRQRRHLMPMGLGIGALQGVLTASTLRDGYQRPALALMARLAPALTSAGPTVWPWPHGLRRITRRRPRGVMGVRLESLQQSLNRGRQFCHACFEGTDICLDGNRRLVPQLCGAWRCGVHGL